MAVYELAFNLGKYAHEVMEEMPYDEFSKWMAFFEEKPIGWREDQRTFMMLRAQGVKESMSTLFPSLAPKAKRSVTDDDIMDVDSLKRSVFFTKMLSSVGGDKIIDDKIESKTT